MSLTKDIAGTAVGLGSLSLVGRSARMVKDSMRPGKHHRNHSRRMMRGMVDLTMGTALLGASAKLVGELD